MSEGCSPHGLCMQCHYHWLRLTLEILAALHVPRDSEIWTWGLQLKLLSSGEVQKNTRRCLGPVSNHQTLPPYSSSLCRACGLPNLVVDLGLSPITAWVMAHSWVCCPDPSPWAFSLSAVSVNISPHKSRDWRSSSCGCHFLVYIRNVPRVSVFQCMVLSVEIY